MGIGLGHADFASFPAIRAVVFAIHAESHTLLALAVAAVAIARALSLRQVALRTENCGLHIFPSPLRRTDGTAPAAKASTKHYRPARRARTSRKCQARNSCATGSNRCPPKKRAASTKPATTPERWFCRGLSVPRSPGRTGHVPFQAGRSPSRRLS
jgi:hypothetical protein